MLVSSNLISSQSHRTRSIGTSSLHMTWSRNFSNSTVGSIGFGPSTACQRRSSLRFGIATLNCSGNFLRCICIGSARTIQTRTDQHRLVGTEISWMLANVSVTGSQRAERASIEIARLDIPLGPERNPLPTAWNNRSQIETPTSCSSCSSRSKHVERPRMRSTRVSTSTRVRYQPDQGQRQVQFARLSHSSATSNGCFSSM